MLRGRGNWVLEVGDSWAVVDHPECLTLTRSEEGALQFSSAEKKSGQVDHADIRHVVGRLDSRGWGDPAGVVLGEFSGLVYSYADSEGVTWRRWFLGRGATLLLVTYNTRKAIPAADEKLINDTLHTLRAQPIAKENALLRRVLAALRRLMGNGTTIQN
jgi:hypothetical protein